MNNILKILWIATLLCALYYYGWVLFYEIVLKTDNGQYSFWNLVAGFLNLSLLVIYSREMLLGYQPISKNRNQNSLLFFLILVVFLVIIQIKLNVSLFADLSSQPWQFTFPFVIILTSYFGIILNRISKIWFFKSV